MRVLSLDPGRTTGVALIKNKITHVDELNGSLDTIWMFLHRQLLKWDRTEPFIIVYEDFLFRQGKMKVDYYPIKVIGIIELFAEQNNIKIAAHNPAMKVFWLYKKASKLKKLGIYRPGVPHAMDALSHGLYYVTFTMKRKDWLGRLKNGNTET